MKRIFILMILLISYRISAYSSSDTVKVDNIDVRISGNRMYIEYDLFGPKEEDFQVSFYLRREGVSSFVYTPVNITGDVGQGKYSGKRRQIVWNFGNEFPNKMIGKDYYIHINAKLISRGISPWVWIGGGAAILGGGAAVLLLGKEKIMVQL